MENKKKWRRIKATTFIPIFWNWEKLFSIILFQSFGIGGNYSLLFSPNLSQILDYSPQLIAKLLQLYFKLPKFCHILAILGKNIPKLMTKIFN